MCTHTRSDATVLSVAGYKKLLSSRVSCKRCAKAGSGEVLLSAYRAAAGTIIAWNEKRHD
jgi:hypothetical protein